MQVENEYGSFNKDKDYMPYVQQVPNAWCVSVFTGFLSLSWDVALRHVGGEKIGAQFLCESAIWSGQSRDCSNFITR